MINGVHAIINAQEVDKARAFFRDVLGFPSIDVGEGWLIFALPPAELGVHPAGETSHELFFLCDNLDATIKELKDKGVEFTSEVSEQTWGRLTAFRVPGAGQVQLYEPKHATTIDR
jgi:catechol 2,3-dioxygenase-like lactoylglutathione lyase family enzyme